MKNLGKILNDTFGKAYVKNLKNSIDRKDFFENNFKKIGLEYEIFEAYEGIKFVNEDFSFQHGPFHITYPSSAGFLGNQMSTEHILTREINNESNSFMIFDDDSYFYNFEKSEDILKTIKSNLPDNWDVVIFGAMHEIYQDYDYHYDRINHHNECAGSHGVAIHSRVYKTWLEVLRNRDFWGDGTIGHLHDIGRTVYYMNPNICAQNRKLYSDINKMYH
jgi:GR25 family glycosyltransferase involved in LPS biosynthesis